MGLHFTAGSRFYLTRPLYEKPHTYFRADVPKELREKLQSITNREPVLMLPNESPIYDKEYRQLLGESKISEDACFWLPEQPKLKACLLTKDNIEPQMKHYFPGYLKSCWMFSLRLLIWKILKSYLFVVVFGLFLRQRKRELKRLNFTEGKGYAFHTLAEWAEELDEMVVFLCIVRPL